MIAHFRFSSYKCPLEDRPCGNIAIDVELRPRKYGLVLSEKNDKDRFRGIPRNLDMSEYIDRLATFETHSKQHSYHVDIAKAGFFKHPVYGDLTCFHCGGMLKNFSTKDDPWLEHAKWFSHCFHIQDERGINYIRKAIKLRLGFRREFNEIVCVKNQYNNATISPPDTVCSVVRLST
ncbi:Hypothetical predicted protein [Cloeon dipterum]|uniref:Uncharacterized protein n=1 Tax=Cloeon dipterum TaxID=197152 RepID=A0A8S1DWN8_9INSE|nr:Hypothetical predicted protein [Cloeon dipterum]